MAKRKSREESISSPLFLPRSAPWTPLVFFLTLLRPSLFYCGKPMNVRNAPLFAAVSPLIGRPYAFSNCSYRSSAQREYSHQHKLRLGFYQTRSLTRQMLEFSFCCGELGWQFPIRKRYRLNRHFVHRDRSVMQSRWKTQLSIRIKSTKLSVSMPSQRPRTRV